ncbi:Putative 37S ribosomal protein S18, mitochondrial [Psilocybe cubensis]|uniref:37S ribosomal protein S18, mitochondrial n=2 Tax=Psilocybe cubensis TaxID=181762 RepID=A0ACB8H4I1_PSICU|nr:Putative 37S ribosomal protein S18, mitochondrial [Psilocybe cubensis]KAH9482602.1 Putative 37S ribosomal protein S18, mitochondrial [Psilocybe cubensis]
MFALRASSSSTRSALRTCPRLFASFSSTSRANAAGPVIADFLEEDSGPASATPFNIAEPPQVDGPPTAAGGFYAKSNMLGLASRYNQPPRAATRAELPEYKLHCRSSRNNTIVTFTKPDGSTIAWCSGGSTENKFKKANRAKFEAGYQCAKHIFGRILEYYHGHENFKLQLFFKGFGEGREAMKTALLAAEGDPIRPLISRVTDRTPIKIGGTRAKKARRG